MSKILFINFGFANVPHEAPEGFVERVDIPLPRIKNPADPKEAAEAAREMVQEAIPFLKTKNEYQDVIFGLPELPLVAVATVSILNGLTGRLPAVSMAIRKESGDSFYRLQRGIYLQELFNDGRELRELTPP